ncbi:MAG: 2-amino-4-hydroxy-6-hydroxymethyldihydropteridine diphosphokinase [Chloroflexi bacterium]|nr:2-amino-4-hydroxy-6-hydroxymethyldihydropteridine diphosphokinase [Chloroflexota bacterium]
MPLFEGSSQEHELSGPATVYLCLGSNLGDRELNLLMAVERLADKIQVEKLSSPYETEPVGYKEQPWFLNACCRAITQLEPFSLLAFAKEIELSMGRKPSFPNASRIIDIDIVFYGDLVMETPQLVIPHPRIDERAFVLIPLIEIAPGLICPKRGVPLETLLENLIKAGRVKRLAWRSSPHLDDLQGN